MTTQRQRQAGTELTLIKSNVGTPLKIQIWSGEQTNKSQEAAGVNSKPRTAATKGRAAGRQNISSWRTAFGLEDPYLLKNENEQTIAASGKCLPCLLMWLRKAYEKSRQESKDASSMKPSSFSAAHHSESYR